MTEEELESIPWSRLLEEGRPRGNRLIYIAAGAIILFALAAIAARTLWRPSVAEPPPLAVSMTTAPTTTSVPAALPVLFSEADLMAALDAESSRAAAAFAEWFVYDFFTVDGDPNAIEAVAEALPPGVPADLLPHGSTDKVTYVEWARSARVTEISAGRFEVLVMFRTVSADPDTPYARGRMRAVTVPMQMSGSGGFRLTELPAPAFVPQRPDVPTWESPLGPGAAGPNAAATALSWRDTAFEGLEAELIDGRWRLLFRNALESGTAWPFLIELPEDFGKSEP